MLDKTGGSMGKTRAVFPLAIFVPLILAIPAVAQHEHGAGEPEKLGKVEFAISCDPALQPQFNRAVALLHSFWYKKAAETFAGIARQDPSCGMAQWGVAMTHYHQLWEAHRECHGRVSLDSSSVLALCALCLAFSWVRS